MKEFIKIQYRLYLANTKSIGIEKIKQLANIFMIEDERADLFKTEGGDT